MSADLFAEFTQPASNSAPPKQQQQPPPPSTPSFGFQNSSQGKPTTPDSFSFNTGTRNSFSQPAAASAIQWPSTQSQQSIPSAGWSSSGWGDVQSQQHQAEPEVTAEEDDTWGDFEVAEQNQPAAVASTASHSLAGWDSGPATQPQPSQHNMAFQQPPQYSPPPTQRPQAQYNNFGDFGFNEQPYEPPEYNAAATRPKKVVTSRASDPNVLFDAEDFELDGTAEDDGFDDDDDDFGDFETVQAASNKPVPQQKPPAPAPAPAPVPTQNMPSMDLLSLDDSELSIQQQQVHSQPTSTAASSSKISGLKFGALNKERSIKSQPSPTPKSAISTASQKRPPQPKASAVVDNADAWGANENDESWASWDDTPSNVQTTAPPKAANEPEAWGWDDSSAQPDASPVNNDSAPPPVNVPPPSIILSTFPELFKLGEPLFKSIAGQNAATKQQLLSNPKTLDFLKSYIMLATTAGRVIAGRKQRWHRDKILAKSMSISAAGSKGMKLAGVDKTQSAREDREAADVVAAWRESVGRLRSAVIIANSSANANLKVPELSETILVQTAKVVPTAPKPCVICGLKRDERVSKVDFEVEDSFGEWWVEHWGHRQCKNFWIEHEKKLRQR